MRLEHVPWDLASEPIPQDNFFKFFSKLLAIPLLFSWKVSIFLNVSIFPYVPPRSSPCFYYIQFFKVSLYNFTWLPSRCLFNILSIPSLAIPLRLSFSFSRPVNLQKLPLTFFILGYSHFFHSCSIALSFYYNNCCDCRLHTQIQKPSVFPDHALPRSILYETG